MKNAYTVYAQQAGLTSHQLRETMAAFGWNVIFGDLVEVFDMDIPLEDMLMVYAWESSDADTTAQVRQLLPVGGKIDDTKIRSLIETRLIEGEISILQGEELQEGFDETLEAEVFAPEVEAYLQTVTVTYDVFSEAGSGGLIAVLIDDLAYSLTILSNGLLEGPNGDIYRFAHELTAPTLPPGQRITSPVRKGCLAGLLGWL